MVAFSLYLWLCLLILLSLLHPGFMVLPSQQEVNQVILCGERGLSDYTAVEVGEFDNNTGFPPLPPCVTDCPNGTVAASTSCVIPEIRQTHGVRFNFALKFTCTALDGCPWLNGGASTQAMFIRVCQWLKIPEREVKAAHISFDASRADDLRGVFIARQGESGYNDRRLSSSESPSSRVTFIAVRVDTKRLAAGDEVIKRVLAYDATSVAWFLNMDVSLFNASLMLGLPAWGVDVWFQLIYGFTGEEWTFINMGKIDIPPGAGDSPPPTTVTTTALVTTTRTVAATTTLSTSSGQVYDDSGSEEKASSDGSGLVPVIAVGCIALAVLLCFFVVFYSRLKRNQQFEDHGKQAAEHQVNAVKAATQRVRTRSKDFSETSSEPKGDIDLEKPSPDKSATDGATEPPSLAARARKPPIPNAHVFRSKEQVAREPSDRFSKTATGGDSEKVPTSGRSHYSSSPFMDPDVVGARTNGEPSAGSATQQEDRGSQRQNVYADVDRKPSKDRFSSRDRFSSGRDGAQSERLGAQDEAYKTPTSSQRIRGQSRANGADPGVSSQAREQSQERRHHEKKQQVPQPEVRRPASAENGATRSQGTQSTSREKPQASKQQPHTSSTETSLDDINLLDVDSITALETQMEAMRRAPFAQRKNFYHQQCLKWHPDKNPNDARTAQQVFQHLQTRKDWFLS